MSAEICIDQAVPALRGIEALPSRIPIVKEAKFEREFAECRPEATIEIELGRSAIRKSDTCSGNPRKKLQILCDVQPRLVICPD